MQKTPLVSRSRIAQYAPYAWASSYTLVIRLFDFKVFGSILRSLRLFSVDTIHDLLRYMSRRRRCKFFSYRQPACLNKGCLLPSKKTKKRTKVSRDWCCTEPIRDIYFSWFDQSLLLTATTRTHMPLDCGFNISGWTSYPLYPYPNPNSNTNH